MTNPFTAFQFKASGVNVNTPIAMPPRLSYRKDVMDYGCLGDGTGAKLNTRYGSLAAAQAVYPFVTNIATQSIDWAGIMGAVHWNDIFLNTTQSNQTASFNGAITAADFTGTISGNNLTVSGVTGTIIAGQVILAGSGVASCQIVSGSGTSWVVNGSSQTVGPVGMTTNAVLVAASSGFSGTIGTGSTNLVVGSGVNVSFIVSQFSGSAGSFGTYALDRGGPSFNLPSQAMFSASCVLTFASVPAALTTAGVPINLTNPSTLGGPSISSIGSTTVTLNYVLGVIQSGDTIEFAYPNKDTIVIPPGSYVVSEPIDFGIISNISIEFDGALGASTITGSFAEYVFFKGDGAAGGFGSTTFKNLTVVNNDANGGGLRTGSIDGGVIFGCTVVANRGINTAQSDTGGAGATSLECSIENCYVSPGSNTSGSIGIMTVTDGPIFNCRIIGYETGMILWGQEGAQYIAGCHFEGNEVAFKPGFDPTDAPIGDSGITMAGCSFKNNGTAMYLAAGGGCRYTGVVIEADESVMVYGAIPQYGINIQSTNSFFTGVTVTGQYEQFAIAFVTATAQNSPNSQFVAVNASNTSTHGGVAWLPPTTPQTSAFYACNCPAPVYSVASLPAFPIGITSLSWASGMTTAKVAFNVGQFIGEAFTMTISGATPSGYNGAFTVGVAWPVTSATWAGGTATLNVTGLLVTGTFEIIVSGVTPGGYNGQVNSAVCNAGAGTITYPSGDPGGSGSGGQAFGSAIDSDTVIYLQSNPGASSATGTITAVVNLGAAQEGNCYNVDDSSSTTWGTVTDDTGSAHAKVRWSEISNWTVVGI